FDESGIKRYARYPRARFAGHVDTQASDALTSRTRVSTAPGRGRTEAIIMTPAVSWLALLFINRVVATPAGLAHAADPDWKAVQQALGKPGQLQPGDVFRIGMPRTDLSVTVKGVPVKAGFALGSYAVFRQVGDHAMVMGDLVLLDQEIPAVMSG